MNTVYNTEEPPMSQKPRFAQTESPEVPKEIAELVAVIDALPDQIRARISPVMDKVVENTKRRRRILNLVQDALSQLRLDMKYLMFDLEATRRERDDYRRQLEGA
jgi:hypothetical protein